MLQPKASWAFLGIVAGAALIYGTLLRPGAIFDRPPGHPEAGVMVAPGSLSRNREPAGDLFVDPRLLCLLCWLRIS
jgi:hypothetical protein